MVAPRDVVAACLPDPAHLGDRMSGKTCAVTGGGGVLCSTMASALAECGATIHRALDAGLNLIDTAPSYEDGYSEQIVGTALNGRRHGVFVIDKIDHPDQPVANQVEASLKRLRMDAVDLFVFHGVSELSRWQQLAAPGGGLDALARCVRDGKARFRGVSSHHPDVVRAAIRSGHCAKSTTAVRGWASRRGRPRSACGRGHSRGKPSSASTCATPVLFSFSPSAARSSAIS